MAYSYHKLYQIDVSVVRYFTVFGTCGSSRYEYFRFIKWIDEGVPIQIFGDGSQSRDFTYVDDIARGTIAAIQDVGYQIINLGGGKNPVSLNTIISNLEELLGKKAKFDYKSFHVADLMETWADISKAKNLLEWKPQVSLDEGLEKSVQWYMDNQHWLKEVQV
jgi:nucleoside-diphosphate-sugar epimerase